MVTYVKNKHLLWTNPKQTPAALETALLHGVAGKKLSIIKECYKI